MTIVQTPAEFTELVFTIEATPGYRKPIGFGICRVDKGQVNREKILSCEFPVTNWSTNLGSAAIFQKAAGLTEQIYAGPEIVTSVTGDFLCAALEAFTPFAKEAGGQEHRNVQVIQTLHRLEKSKAVKLSDYRLVFLYEDAQPQSIPSIYLKLLALSKGDAALRSLDLSGIFGKLENVAWAGGRPIELEYLRQQEIEMRLTGTYPVVDFIDKFPRYLQHIIPADNTRILDASRVRLGAHLGAGTTVMPGASYVNFNAGTLGAAMVEGRISSSAIVGEETDIGGGASILGVLSGGNSIPITIGKKCLLGANSVTGISLGDGCIVDAGVSVLAGSRVFIAAGNLRNIDVINPERALESKTIGYRHGLHEFKAAALSGCNGLHFRDDDKTGRKMVMRSAREVALNDALHY